MKKCLEAGFRRVAVVSPSPQKLAQIDAAITAGLGAETARKVIHHSPDGMILEMKDMVAIAPQNSERAQEPVINGRRVKRNHLTLLDEERKRKDDFIRQMVCEVMRYVK